MHDLYPYKPHRTALRNKEGHVVSPSYNMVGWHQLQEFLTDHGVDISEFDGLNNGRPICAATCRAVADAIEGDLEGYAEIFDEEPWWGQGKVLTARQVAHQWRTAGGFRQW